MASAEIMNYNYFFFLFQGDYSNIVKPRGSNTVKIFQMKLILAHFLFKRILKPWSVISKDIYIYLRVSDYKAS